MLTWTRGDWSWFALVLVLDAFCLFMSWVFRDSWPLGAYLIPLLLSTNVLRMSRVLVVCLVTLICMVISLALIDVTGIRLAGAGLVVLGAIILTLHTQSRARFGLLPFRGDTMLIDLRDRLASQGALPALPRGWFAEAVTRSAGGASFSGDFVVAAKTRGGRLLEIAVVDVSGKGVEAGTRSLQLSGAFGGLLGSLSPEEFLPTANEYLIRQDWSEGFATAVHLAIDLVSGAFEVRTAGHPPAVQFLAGSGRWVVHWTRGPVLGVVLGAEFSVHRGEMLPGDAMMLYTDGLVEAPSRDIAFGIDKLLGEAERLVQRGFGPGGAERLVSTVNVENDDRALLLVARR